MGQGLGLWFLRSRGWVEGLGARVEGLGLRVWGMWIELWGSPAVQK
jgi:hypothetical protein